MIRVYEPIGQIYGVTSRRLGLIQYIKPFLFAFIGVQVPPVLIKDGIFSFFIV